jgi:hypothetical protein
LCKDMDVVCNYGDQTSCDLEFRSTSDGGAFEVVLPEML